MHYFRQLCLDALVEEGDRNFDWRLSFDEFKDLLSDSFVPSTKGNWLKLKLYVLKLPSNFLTLFILYFSTPLNRTCTKQILERKSSIFYALILIDLSESYLLFILMLLL